MKRSGLVLLLIILGVGVSNAGDKTLKQWLSQTKPLLAVDEAGFESKITVADNRIAALKDEPLEGFAILLKKYITTDKETMSVDSENTAKASNFIVQYGIKVTYLGFYKTDGGSVIGKFLADINGKLPLTGKSLDSTVVYDEYYKGIKSEKDMREQRFILLKDAAAACQQKIKEMKSELTESCKSVVDRGYVKIDASKGKARSRAIQSALRNAAESAFGVEVSSITTMKDMGDVTDLTRSSSRALVVKKEVLERYSTTTTDGYEAVVVKTILMR